MTVSHTSSRHVRCGYAVTFLTMNTQLPPNNEEGKIGWAILWLLGVPLPVLLIAYLLFGHH